MADAEAAPDFGDAIITEHGIAMHNEFPLNHRLRAEALVTAGLADDPDGIISADLIADTGDRMKAEAEADAAQVALLKAKPKEELAAAAEAKGMQFTDKPSKADLVDALAPQAAPAAPVTKTEG